ncbi:MAG TPA: hypothetical protein VHZ54_19765 [Solirubrobacterales bacterium]|nr:hypothetical protein [Solirubrobacterales bacterium]
MGTLFAVMAVLCALPPAAGAFAFQPGQAGFSVGVSSAGEPASLAGSHPHALIYHLAFTEGALRNLHILMPPGLLENQTAVSQCSPSQFQTHRVSPFESSLSGESCPQQSQVGVVQVTRLGGESRSFGLFDLEPAPGVPAQLGFAPWGEHITFDSAVAAPQDNYALSLNAVDIPQGLEVSGLEVEIWGVPWSAVNDPQRGNCLNEAERGRGWGACSVGPPSQQFPFAYLTLPANCTGALTIVAGAEAWQGGGGVTAEASNRDSLGNPVAEKGCESLTYEPVPSAFLTETKASSSSGYAFGLKVNYKSLLLPNFRVQAQTREIHVTLPPGTTVNPSVGAGLGVCTPAQYASETPEWSAATGCPSTSKIGEFRLHSPLYREWIAGGIYLAQPHQNPFNSLVAIYLIAKSPERGVLVKVAGTLEPKPGTGSLSATFTNLPQLPYTELEAEFRTGQRSLLVSPSSCGPAPSQMTLAAWPVGLREAHETSVSTIETGIERSPCPSGATPPFHPEVSAGGVNSNVNSYTPYFVHISRTDAEQEITSYSLVLPKGITGKIAGIPYCPDASIEAARHNEGFAEAAHPSCPAASEIGHTDTGYGVGPALTYTEGHMYLAGPYHGAPLSLVTINPATVGPFDLGTVVVRSAFSIDPLTAQLAIDSHASDPIPHILDGIPLHLRDIRIYIDRPEFTHNPSSCEPSALVSTLTGSGASFEDPADDSTAVIEKHFQLLNCLTLDFRPKLALHLEGASRRGGYPSLQANFSARGAGDSNLKRIEVDLPHQLFLAQNHIRGVCTRVQFAANACPANSRYGTATAVTPLLDEPLRGNVYLRSSSNKLPDLVAQLRSGSIEFDLEGRIGPTKRGGIQAFFDNLPDAPIERFVMKLNGGKHGLLTNSVDVCAVPPFAEVRAVAQNNRGAIFRSLLHSRTCQKRAKKKHGHGGHGK